MTLRPFQAPLNATVSAAPEGALTDPSRTLRYAELPAAFEALRAHLEASGVGDGDAVALVCPHSVTGALALLYLLDRGMDFALLPADMPELDDALADLDVCRHHLIVDPGTDGPEARLDWSSRPGEFVTVRPGAPAPAALTGGAALPGQGPRMLLRTSGSMGSAKLVVHAHQAFLGNTQACVERFGLSPADRIALPVPLFHMYGLGAAFVPGVLAGATFDLQPHANLLRYMDRERAFDPNVAFLSPQLCEMMTRRRRAPRPHRLVVTAGAPISEERFRAFDEQFGPLVNLYGSTELGAVAACAPGDPVDRRARGLGRAMPGMTLRVGEGEDEPLKGELRVQTEHGFSAYVDGQGRTLTEASRWFRTRDLVERRGDGPSHDGPLHVLGRIDSAVNRDGRLVMLADIEARIARLPELAQVVVVPDGLDGRHGPRLTAFCVPLEQPDLEPRTLRARCASLLPPYAIPETLRLLPELPTLPSGKVDRKRLTTMASQA